MECLDEKSTKNIDQHVVQTITSMPFRYQASQWFLLVTVYIMAYMLNRLNSSLKQTAVAAISKWTFYKQWLL